MTDVPVVLRVQSVYLRHRVVVFGHFLAARVASIELRACCFKPKWSPVSIRGDLGRPTFVYQVVSRLTWSSIPPSCRDQCPLASRPKGSVGGLHLWRRVHLVERAERISSHVSLLRMTLAMCGYSVPIIVSRQYRKSCTCQRYVSEKCPPREGESTQRAISVSKVSSWIRRLQEQMPVSPQVFLAPAVTGWKGAKPCVPCFQRSELDVSRFPLESASALALVSQSACGMSKRTFSGSFSSTASCFQSSAM